MFTDYMLAIVKFCAEECRRQGSGEESVAWMVNAYDYAVRRFAVDHTVTEEDILDLLRMIEPEKNAGGYRTQPCHFGSFIFTSSQNIPRSIQSLLGSQDELVARDASATTDVEDVEEAVRRQVTANAVAFYTELEKIHPGADGNGRLGAILFNLKNGTLLEPVAAPDVFAK